MPLFDVYIFVYLHTLFTGGNEAPFDTRLIVAAPDELHAAAFALRQLEWPAVEAINVVPQGSGLDVEGVTLHDCQLEADGSFVYSMPDMSAPACA